MISNVENFESISIEMHTQQVILSDFNVFWNQSTAKTLQIIFMLKTELYPV